MRTLCFTSLLIGLIAQSVWAAPVLKEKEDAPPTKEQAQASVNNLKQFGLAIHNYHDANGFFPQNIMKDGKPILSWRVQLLPYLDETEAELWKAIKKDEPWDGPNNKKLIEKIPTIYKPVRGKASAGETFYQMFAWEGGLVRPNGGRVGMANVTDGLSNTLMVVEAYTPVIWLKPDDIPFNPKDKELPKLGKLFEGDFHSVMGDGAVRKIKKTVAPESLRRLIQPNDGQNVDVNKAAEGTNDDPPSTAIPLPVPAKPK